VSLEGTAPPRLYAILDTGAAAARGLTPGLLLATWLDAGIRLVQLRAKSLTLGPMVELAESAVRACEGYGARLIINDRVDVAALSGAAGVHLGQTDLSPNDARRIIGDRAWLGLSTHDDRQVEAALAEPISYVAIGPVYPTLSKENPEATVGLAGVTRAATLAHRRRLPLVAIGGITLRTAPDVLAAGADAIAVITGLLGGAPAASAADWVRAIG
jgi:thiamine-phosphate pyrophosphorylase